MEKKMMAWKTKGMNQDLSVSAFNPEFSFENMNLRLATNDGNTMLSWVNEKGTKRLTLSIYNSASNNIIGVPIGTAIINNKLVVFTAGESGSGYIYVFSNTPLAGGQGNADLYGKLLYSDPDSSNNVLGFSAEHPLETLVSYESEDVQKVYWTDGVNQPRMINIAASDDSIEKWNSTSFDFVQKLKLEETVTVQKLFNYSGTFAPGVIQYAFTYYNKNGQESNIFYTTPLLYISHRDRGASPEESVDNAFKITITNPDENFEYVRIYSIQRTSLNSTPLVKRVQDLSIAEMETGGNFNEKTAFYVDRGISGNTVDPTELLYKGGTSITAETLAQKDGTLFLGNVTVTEDEAISDEEEESIVQNLAMVESNRDIYTTTTQTGAYDYYCQLNAYSDSGLTKSVPCSYFKKDENYRWGLQFQHETGKWSQPVWVNGSNKSKKISHGPSQGELNGVPDNRFILPRMMGILDETVADDLYNQGYRKVRAVVVFPNITDRSVLCQGVVNPTLYTDNHRTWEDPSTNPPTLKGDNDLYAQSSWFFRANVNGGGRVNPDGSTTNPGIMDDGRVSPKALYGILEYTNNNIGDYEENISEVPTKEITGASPANLRQVEVQGQFNEENKFKIDRDVLTFHSPDVEFDTQLSVLELNNFYGQEAGHIKFTKTFADLSIQTETPAIGNDAGGFDHKTFFGRDGSAGIVSGLFYEDYVVDEADSSFAKLGNMKKPCRWLVYPWNKGGSLNNDIVRPANGGVSSATLMKKVLSNFRYSAKTEWDGPDIEGFGFVERQPQLFSSNEVSIVKIGNDKNYEGNIDTMLTPDDSEGMYFAFGEKGIVPEAEDDYYEDIDADVNTDFTSESWWKTFTTKDSETENHGIYKYGQFWRKSDMRPPGHLESVWRWKRDEGYIGDAYFELARKRASVRMTYKSTPHFVFGCDGTALDWGDDNDNPINHSLPVVEIRKDQSQNTSLFGGETKDALKENIWIPCGRPVRLDDISVVLIDDVRYEGVKFYWEYGDTYYQRWDCLKTYPFTKEDVNQIVEIGSFMLETRINIDGRYDRNRGLQSNLNVRPENFNLLNSVYSQEDNFFQYKILDDNNDSKRYPNVITWTKAKESGADVDLWTNITLASTLELDGDKGGLNKLIRLNDSLLAFQDTGISQVLYNENVQIQSTEGVPIELANSGKVQGKRYISNTIGCSNKWSMTTTPLGIYFIDSHEDSIYLFNGELNNLSMKNGMNSAVKRLDSSTNVDWNPLNFKNIVTYYDKKNQDVLFFNGTSALAYSEKIGTFTSFYNYKGGVYLCNLEGRGIWIGLDETPQTTGYYFWGHQEGDYCKFFNIVYPYWMILVGNPEPLLDKTFTNLEFRACVTGDGSTKTEDEQVVFDNFYLPFDSLEVWDEYQHGLAALSIKNGGMGDGKHHLPADSIASLNRKFRIWRCDIPRDNAPVNSSTEASMGITRFKIRPLDRMRNPWIYLKLMKNVEEEQNIQLPMHKVEIHDMVMSYFI